LGFGAMRLPMAGEEIHREKAIPIIHRAFEAGVNCIDSAVFFCFSFHDSCKNLIKLVDTDMFESVTCQYNLFDRANEEGIARAHEKNMGVVIMGPVAGGRLGETGGKFADILPASVSSTPELALRFVMANPNVTAALSGMSTMQQVEENVVTASRGDTLSADELAAVTKLMKQLSEMAKLYYTGCKYCQPCPQGVGISDIFSMANQYRVYGAANSAREAYKKLMEENKEDRQPATACVQCGECEPKCPQKIKTMDQFKKAHELLAG